MEKLLKLPAQERIFCAKPWLAWDFFNRAGVNTLQFNPDGPTLDERLANLARLVELVKEIDAEP